MRVDRAFAFVDLCGFTAYTDREGDDAARAVLTAFRSVVRATVDEHGVRVAKWLGDGAMVVAVEPMALAAALVELHGRMANLPRHLPVRSGMTFGPVMVFEGDDYIGSTVNLAARLCDLAGEDEILVEGGAVPTLGDEVLGADLGPRRIAGFGTTVQVTRLLGVRRALVGSRAGLRRRSAG